MSGSMKMNPEDVANAMIYDKSPVNWLMEICVKKNVYLRFITMDKRTDPTHPPNFEVSVTVPKHNGFDKAITATYFGRSKKVAKTRCAIVMLNLMGITKADLFALCDDKTKEIVAEARNNSSPPPEVSEDSSSQKLDTDFRSLLLGYCYNLGLTHPSFEVVKVSGPSHGMEFTMSCQLESTRGDRKQFFVQETMRTSKKNLKKILAGKMIEILKQNYAITTYPMDIHEEKVLEKVVEEVKAFSQSHQTEDLNGMNDISESTEKVNGIVSSCEEWKLGGPTLKEIHKLYQAKKLLDIDDFEAWNFLKKLRDDQIANGFIAEFEHSVFPNGDNNGFIGYSTFTFDEQKVSGQGEAANETSAIGAGNKQVLQILAELTYP